MHPEPTIRKADLTDADYRKASVHLHYEITMFEALAGLLTSGAVSDRLKWAAAEAFVMHARNLTDVFFPPTATQESDLLASDFVLAPNQWKPGDTPEILCRARTRAHKEVAHLTYNRIYRSPQDWLWNVPAICDVLRPTIRDFIRLAAPARLDAETWRQDPLATAAVIVTPAPDVFKPVAGTNAADSPTSFSTDVSTPGNPKGYRRR